MPSKCVRTPENLIADAHLVEQVLKLHINSTAATALSNMNFSSNSLMAVAFYIGPERIHKVINLANNREERS